MQRRAHAQRDRGAHRPYRTPRLTMLQAKHITVCMSDVIRLAGAIDRHSPDPTSPHDPMSAWIGMLEVSYDEVTKSAAIIKVATGRGSDHALWGQYTLLLRWIGDPPPVEISRAVYDIVQDGGPKQRRISGTWRAQPRTEAQHSYRTAARA